MKLSKHAKALMAALILFIALPLCAEAASGGGQPVQTYYDGGQPRRILLDEALVAEFGTAPAAVRMAAPDARVEKRIGGAVIYRVSPDGAKAAIKLAAPRIVSPVFHLGGSPNGPLMTLPGGVLVNFNAGWGSSQIYAWAAGQGLTMGSQLQIGGNWWMVNSAAGQASLDLANQIQASGQVVSATPNWMMEFFIDPPAQGTTPPPMPVKP